MIDDINAAPDYGDEPPIACFSSVFLGRDSFACGGTPGHGGKHGYRLPWVTIEWDGKDAATQDDVECPDCGLHKPLRAVRDEAEQESARYALVEQMGFRRTYGTIRETEFAGKPMAEVTPLDGSGVRLVAPESLYQVTWLTRDQAEHATRTGAHAVAAIGSAAPLSHVNLSGADPFGAWADDDDTDPDEGKDDGMSSAEREAYDRDAEFALDAADEARDLEREAEATA